MCSSNDGAMERLVSNISCSDSEAAMQELQCDIALLVGSSYVHVDQCSKMYILLKVTASKLISQSTFAYCEVIVEKI